MPVKLINNTEVFKLILACDKLVISFFSVPWCPRCCQMAPIFRKLSGIYSKAKFIKVDCMEHPEISEFNQVAAYPTFIFFENKVRRDQLIGGDACMLLKKIQIHYGNVPLNLDDAGSTKFSHSEHWKHKDLEFDPEGSEDDALGNNSHFLARMKANCEHYSLVFKELDEKKITASAVKVLARESKFKVDVETKPKEKRIQSILAISRQDSADRKTIPLLVRVANLPTDEDINLEDETPRPTQDSERDQTISSMSAMRPPSPIRFPEIPQLNVISEIEGPSQLHQSIPQIRVESHKEVAETKSEVSKQITQLPNQSPINKGKPPPQVKPGKAPVPQKKPVKKPPPKKKGK